MFMCILVYLLVKLLLLDSARHSAGLNGKRFINMWLCISCEVSIPLGCLCGTPKQEECTFCQKKK